MKHLTLIALALLPIACTSEATTTGTAEVTSAAGPVADQVIPRTVHGVECGCAIESVGHCGNYVSLEGAYLEIAKEGAGAELGSMEWCGQSGVTAEVEGEVKDGKFIATYIKTVTP